MACLSSLGGTRLRAASLRGDRCSSTSRGCVYYVNRSASCCGRTRAWDRLPCSWKTNFWRLRRTLFVFPFSCGALSFFVFLFPVVNSFFVVADNEYEDEFGYMLLICYTTATSAGCFSTVRHFIPMEQWQKTHVFPHIADCRPFYRSTIQKLYQLSSCYVLIAGVCHVSRSNRLRYRVWCHLRFEVHVVPLLDVRWLTIPGVA